MLLSQSISLSLVKNQKLRRVSILSVVGAAFDKVVALLCLSFLSALAASCVAAACAVRNSE